MTRAFPQVLSDLARDLQAGAAILWCLGAARGGGHVVACSPSDLLEPGTPWVTQRLATFEEEADPLGAMLPTALRLALPGPATGAGGGALGLRGAGACPSGSNPP